MELSVGRDHVPSLEASIDASLPSRPIGASLQPFHFASLRGLLSTGHGPVLLLAMEVLLHDYLRPTPIIDCDHPAIRERAALLRDGSNTMRTIARCFEWVRDEIRHSIDFGDERVTLIASDALLQGTGLCYAKSHLLAALLRANEIPCGLVYQRLADNDSPSGFCLHGLNAVWLPEQRWFRIDARGNRPNRTTCFAPPTESLAFTTEQPGEFTSEEVFCDALPVVIEALSRSQQVSTLLAHLPDVVLAANR